MEEPSEQEEMNFSTRLSRVCIFHPIFSASEDTKDTSPLGIDNTICVITNIYYLSGKDAKKKPIIQIKTELAGDGQLAEEGDTPGAGRGEWGNTFVLLTD